MDISELLLQPHDMNPGSAAPYLEGFAAEMASMGHTSSTISFYLGSTIHFGGWLEARGWIWRTLMRRPSKHSGYIAAIVLDAGARNGFREPMQHVFSASQTSCGNAVPSG
jgi:hypothetical protein